MIVFACIFLFLSVSVQARPLWGPTGHALIASIAQTLLNSDSTKEALTLLPANNGQMSAVASWADQIRSDPQWEWTAPLHYINTPDWACYYNPSTDCPDNMCVAGAIFNYSNQLANPQHATFNATQDAFMFVIHFLGDIHQPLHVAFASDRGGNTIEGTYYGDDYNLHSIWDTALINTRIQTDFGGSQNDYLKYLLSEMTGVWKNQVKTWSTCNNTKTSPYVCPDEWATETAIQACTYAYTDQDGDHIENGFSLASSYFNFVKEVVDMQLVKGGVRLAQSLNAIWKN